MVEHGNLPDNPNSFASRVRTVTQNQLLGARADLGNSREVQFRANFAIDAAETLTEKKALGERYKLGVMGVMDATIVIADQKVREKKPLEDLPQEIISRTNLIKLALQIQLGREVSSDPIRGIIEELGLQADRELLVDRIKDAVKIDSEDIDREVLEKAVWITHKTVSLVRKIQERLGVKKDPLEYE